MLREKSNNLNTVKSILVAYLVLVLHVLLVGFVGILVLFFRGVVNYMSWILFFGVFINLLFIIYFFSKIKHRRAMKKKIVSQLEFNNRPLEIDFFDRLASFKLDSTLFDNYDNTSSIKTKASQFYLCKSSKIREINKLAGLLEKKLITIDEYNEAKRDIF